MTPRRLALCAATGVAAVLLFSAGLVLFDWAAAALYDTESDT